MSVAFPDYYEPISNQDAGTSVETTCTKLAASPPWNGRDKFKIWYNTTYGTQTDDWWTARQVHHIRPRVYGGTDDNSNLMPIPVANHQLITSWFVNY